MIPLRIPTHSFSARCAVRAVSTGSHESPDTAVKTRTVPTSSAADEDRLAPSGMLDASAPLQPER